MNWNLDISRHACGHQPVVSHPAILPPCPCFTSTPPKAPQLPGTQPRCGKVLHSASPEMSRGPQGLMCISRAGSPGSIAERGQPPGLAESGPEPPGQEPGPGGFGGLAAILHQPL